MAISDSYHRPGIILPLLILVSTFAVPRVLGQSGDLPNIIKAFIAVSILYLAALAISLRVFRGIGSNSLVYKNHIQLRGIFAGFIFLAVISLIIGFEKGYSVRYLIGDFYKFVIPAVCVFSFYFLLDDRRKYERIFYYFYWFGFCFLLFTFSIYIYGVMGLNERFDEIYYLPTLLILGYHFSSINRKTKISFYSLILGTPLFIYFSQSLGLLIGCFMLPALTLALWRCNRRQLVKFSVCIGLLGGFLLYLVMNTGLWTILLPEGSNRGYLVNKFIFLGERLPLLEKLELIGGSRVREPSGILEEISKEGATGMLFGAGMGSTFECTSLFKAHTRWSGEDHFVHAGLAEAMLRTGMVGAVLYLLVIFLMLKITYRYRRVNILTALAAASVIFQLLFILSNSWLGNNFFFFFLVSYSLALGGERLKAKAPRS